MFCSYSLTIKHCRHTRSCMCILAPFPLNLTEMSHVLVTSSYTGIISYKTKHVLSYKQHRTIKYRITQGAPYCRVRLLYLGFSSVLPPTPNSE